MSSDQLPSDLADAHGMIVALRSETKVRRLETEKLKFIIAKLRREQFGQSSERGPKVAITALMLKLVVLANAHLRKIANGPNLPLEQNGYSLGASQPARRTIKAGATASAGAD